MVRDQNTKTKNETYNNFGSVQPTCGDIAATESRCGADDLCRVKTPSSINTRQRICVAWHSIIDDTPDPVRRRRRFAETRCGASDVHSFGRIDVGGSRL
jgi:hypothetical protein